MVVLKFGYCSNITKETGSTTKEGLRALVATEEYLFHVTSASTLPQILESGTIQPLTIDGLRSVSLKRKGLEERGTASFTSDPIELYEYDQSGCFDDKNVVLVLNRNKLVKQGVFKAAYVPEEVILRVHLTDYTFAPEGADFENEWRSVDAVDIKDALEYLVTVPAREYNRKTNLNEFK